MPPKAVFKSPRCTVCSNQNRHKIEALNASGMSLDSIAAKFGVSRDSVHRHCKNHVEPERKAQYLLDVPIAELASRAAAENVSLIDNLSLVRSTLMQALLTAASVGDRHALAALSGRAVEVLKEIGKLTGEVSRITSVTNNFNFAESPMFALLQAMLIERLASWPEALASVVEGLGALDALEAEKAASEPLRLTVRPSDV